MEEILTLGYERGSTGKPTLAVHLATDMIMRAKTDNTNHKFALLVSSEF
jgi:acyl-coenzyme A synthetase/AMP-(fatty) acid ligase